MEHPSQPERGDDLESDTSEKSEEDHGLVRQHAKKKRKVDTDDEEIAIVNDVPEESTPSFNGNYKPQSRISETSDGDSGTIEHPRRPERGEDLESDPSETSDEDGGPVRRPVESDDEEIARDNDVPNFLTDTGTASGECEDTVDENIEDVMEVRLPPSGSCNASSIDLEAERIFKKFHKRVDHLLPSHLPGKPSSFQAFLTSVFPDPSNSVVERANIHASSAKASTYKDNRTRALLAATFPPIRVGSLAGEATDVSFQGDVFPQFTHIAKGNYKCAICVPYLRWAIQNNQPHSVARSRKATTDAILFFFLFA